MEPEHEERRLTTILAADVVGYSRLMAADEAGTFARLKAHRKELLEPKTTEYHGRVVKLTGDGTLMEFGSVVDAVLFAVDVQRAMVERNASVLEDRQITYRIGINIGDVIVEGDDIYGDGVNVAARLEGLAEPGGVCISRTVFNHVKAKVDFGFEDLGEQRLKNIAEPVRVFRIKPDDGESRPEGPISLDEDLPLPEKPSITIVPFTNLSGDPEQDYLADGFRLAIQASLVKISGLFLIAPGTSNKYRDMEVTPERVGRETGVRYVLEGAVQRSEERVRITIQLTDTVAQRVVWAERFDRVLDDTLALQDEITVEVIKALDVKLVSGEETRAFHSTLTNLEALDRFYRGLSLFYAVNKDDNLAARQLFESVARLQPDSPAGPAYVCFTHWLDAFRGWSESRNRSLMQAVQWAEKTIKFKVSNGLAHIVLASIHLLNHRHDEALENCYKAVELRPSCPVGNASLANVLHYCGHSAEAVAKIKKAIRISPVHPPWFVNLLAAAYRETGEVGKSISTAKHTMRLSPDDLDARLILCSDYKLTDRNDQAQTMAQDVIEIDSSFSLAKYAESQPYKDAATLDRLIESLREAGLPE